MKKWLNTAENRPLSAFALPLLPDSDEVFPFTLKKIKK